jgi:hypothetical protein
MTNADLLKQLVEHAERTRGLNAPVAQHIGRQLAKRRHRWTSRRSAGFLSESVANARHSLLTPDA